MSLLSFASKIMSKRKPAGLTLKEEISFIGLILGVYLALWNNEEQTWCDLSWRSDVSMTAKIPPHISGRVMKLEGKPRSVTDDKFFPHSKSPGGSFIDYDARTLYQLIREDEAPAEVVAGPNNCRSSFLEISVVIPFNKTPPINGSSTISAISEVFQVPPTCFHFQGILPTIVPPHFAILRLELSSCTNLAVDGFGHQELCSFDSPLAIDKLKSSFYKGDLDKNINSTIYALRINNKEGPLFQNSPKRQTETNVESTVEYLKPFKLTACCLITQVALQQPFSYTITVLDFRNAKVESMPANQNWTVLASLNQTESNLFGPKEVLVVGGIAHFNDLVLTNSGDEIEFTLMSNGRPLLLVHRFTTQPITVTERPLKLVLSSGGPPYSAIERVPLLPFPQIELQDQLTGTEAEPRDLNNFKWIGAISLKYDDVYDSVLEGNKIVQNVGDKISFPNLVIKKWGLWFYLTVKVYSVPDSGRNYTLDIGPFDVRPASKNYEPIVTYTSRTNVLFSIDADFKDVQFNIFKFYVYFINFFAKRYDKVVWVNVTATPGSILARAEIMGSLKTLNETVMALSADAEKDLSLPYIPGTLWRVKRAAADDKSLDETKKKKEGGGSLPLAWIAAIVINGVLVFLFILFVVYCYCRSKKRSNLQDQDDPYSGQNYGGYNERSYNEKAASNPHQRGRMPGTERAALISTGAQRGVEPRSVFTIENERRRLRDEEDLEDYDEADGYSTPINDGTRNQNGRPASRPISSPTYYHDDQRDHMPTEVQTKGTVTDELDDELEDEYKERLRNYVGYEDDPRSPGANLGTPNSPIQGFKTPSPIPRRYETPPPPPPPPPITPAKTPEAQIIRDKSPENRSETRNLSREGFYYRDPMDMPAVNTVVPVQVPVPIKNEEAWQNPQKSDVIVAPEEKSVQMFDVFLLKEGSGVKSKKGQIALNLEAPMTLTHLRTMLNNSSDTKIKSVTKKKYTFMTDDLRSVDLPEGALLVKNLYPSNAIYILQVDDEWQAPKKKEKPAVSIEPQPVPKIFAVNLYRSSRGVKEFIGEISLPDGGPLTLTHLRSMLCKAPLSIEGLAWKDYVFLSENLQDVSAPEGALLVDLLYPNQEIIFRLLEDETDKISTMKKSKSQTGISASGVPVKASESKKKDFAYVGPMGMCTAAECEKPARIKCLYCGQVGYCTTKHMRDDQFTHKRVCYKPQWKH